MDFQEGAAIQRNEQIPGHGLRPETLLIEGGRPARTPGSPLNTPLYPVSNFRSQGRTGPAESAENPGALGEHNAPRRYARSHGTPGWEAFESIVGTLEGGLATTFSSGMAAVSAALELVPAGGKILLPTDRYMGTQWLLENGQALGRWDVTVVDLLDPDAVVAELDCAQMLWIESPSNPRMGICDIVMLAVAARAAGVLTVADNTFATPLRQRPLQLGADIVVHSATKFMGGHSDLLMGVAVARDPDLHRRLVLHRDHAGATPGALESFLALRGLRTMALRLNAAERSANDLARRLAGHPAVRAVHYPGLHDHPGHALAARQMDGFGSILSFELEDADAADATCEAVQIIEFATSLGGIETTIERRGKHPGQGHVPAGLLRLSVGCEHVEDLWEDLRQALDAAQQLTTSSQAVYAPGV